MIDVKRGNLEGTKLADGRWQIRVTVTTIDGKKLRKAVYGATKSEAQRKAHELIHEERRQVGIDATVSELAMLYRRTIKDLAPRTIISYERSLKLIEGTWGTSQVSALTTPKVVTWLQRLPIGDRSADIVRTVFQAMLGYGKLIGTNRDNPLQGIRLKRRSTPKQSRITQDELNAVLKHLSPAYHAFFRFLATTGLRPWREALELTRANVGREADVFFVTVKASKTKAGERVVPIEDHVALDRILDCAANERLFPFTRNVYRKAWEKARVKAEITADIYSLRRLAITVWCEEKPLDEVRKLAGHESIALTAALYNEVQRNRLLGVHGIKKGIKVSDMFPNDA